MPLIRKRRADQADTQPTDSPLPNNRRQRPREDADSDTEMSDNDTSTSAPSSTDALVKKLVRLALASEYSRLPIRRTDIKDKVLGEHGSRQFKLVFDTAQDQLRSVFGMEMSELPAREKVTVAQRRAALKSEKPSTSNRSWIVTTTLPPKFRSPDILVPARAPSAALESTYTALYSFVIAVITLNGGALSEQKLNRYLTRMNADTYTPVDRTDKLLQRLCREGYVVRTREMDGGEEVIEYLVGPRGKIEVGTTGVAGLVREVYGYGRFNSEEVRGDPDEREVFEARLSRSLGIANVGEGADGGDRDGSQGRRETGGPVEARRSSRRAGREEDEDEDEEDEEED